MTDAQGAYEALSQGAVAYARSIAGSAHTDKGEHLATGWDAGYGEGMFDERQHMIDAGFSRVGLLHFAYQQDDCCSPETNGPKCDYVEVCHECGQDWPCRTYRVGVLGSQEGPSWGEDCAHCQSSAKTDQAVPRG